MPVANIDEAIDEVVYNVWQQSATLRDQLDVWLVIFSDYLTPDGVNFYPLDDASVNERTVRNWKIPSLRVRGELPAGACVTDEVQTVIEVVNRTLEAARYALAQGNITANQLDGIVYQYNLAWPS